jgi:hypothetical protein
MMPTTSSTSLQSRGFLRGLTTFIALFMAIVVSASAAEQRHLYVFRAPKDRDGFRTVKPSIEIHDINNGHKFIKVVPVTVPSGTRPVGDIRGVMANVKTKRIYISHYGATATSSRHHPGWVLCLDMTTFKPLWHKSYDQSVDRGTLSPDGKTIYMPNGETSGLTYWHVIDAATGALKGKVNHIRQTHNTIASQDGRIFMQGFGAPNKTKYSSTVGYRDTLNRSLLVYNPANGARKLVGPFQEVNRPFTINGKGSLVFMTVNDFIGFQVGDVATGKVIHTVKPPRSGVAYTYTGNKSSYNFGQPGDGKGTRCHGIAMTANEKFIYHVDQSRAGVHVWDVSGLPGSAPRWVVFLKCHSGREKDSKGYVYGEVGIYGQPGWISSSYDGRYLYPESGEILDTNIHRIIGNLRGANGKLTHSRFMLELAFSNGVPVRASDQFGVGRITSGTVTPTPTPTAPSAPSSLTARAISSSQISLAWLDNSSDESGFYVERSLDGTSYSRIATVGANVKAYSNTGLTASKKYYYRVRAYNAAGNSSASNIASATTSAATTKPTAPSSLTLSVASSSQINLTWNDNSGNESGFRIERSTDGTTFTQIAQNAAGDRTYSATGLTASKKYYFRVRAYNSAGSSAYSNTASATTKAAADTQAPTAPTGLKLQSKTSSSASIIWTASTDNVGVTGYHVYRNGSKISDSSNVTHVDNGLAPGTYTYSVRALDAAGNVSAHSNKISVTIPAPVASYNGGVSSYILMNADTDMEIGTIANGAVLDLATLPTRNLNIKAMPNGTVGSIKMVLSGAASRTQIESVSPYVLFGHNGNDMGPWTPALGSYTLQSTAYSGADAAGDAGGSLTVNFTVKESVGVVGFTLMNADSDAPITALNDGTVITRSALPTQNLNIRADVNNESAVSDVHFVVSGAISFTTSQSMAPYALFDDANGDYKAWKPAAGTYTIKATATVNGAPGVSKTITIQIK